MGDAKAVARRDGEQAGGALTRLLHLGRSTLPEGTVSVGGAVAVAGVLAFAFLTLAGRVLGPSRDASLSTLGFLGFLAGPGFFLPVEQELASGLAARRAAGVGAGHLVNRVLAIAGAGAAVLVVITFTAGPAAVERLFDGQV